MLTDHPAWLDVLDDGLYGDIEAFMRDYESGSQATWWDILRWRGQKSIDEYLFQLEYPEWMEIN